MDADEMAMDMAERELTDGEALEEIENITQAFAEDCFKLFKRYSE